MKKNDDLDFISNYVDSVFTITENKDGTFNFDTYKTRNKKVSFDFDKDGNKINRRNN